MALPVTIRRCRSNAPLTYRVLLRPFAESSFHYDDSASVCRTVVIIFVATCGSESPLRSVAAIRFWSDATPLERGSGQRVSLFRGRRGAKPE